MRNTRRQFLAGLGAAGVAAGLGGAGMAVAGTGREVLTVSDGPMGVHDGRDHLLRVEE